MEQNLQPSLFGQLPLSSFCLLFFWNPWGRESRKSLRGEQRTRKWKCDETHHFHRVRWFILNKNRVTWWAFGQLPERFSFFCLHINRISEKKLSDVVSIVNVEFANRFCNTVIKAFGKIFDHLSHCLLFLSFQSIKIFRLYYFFQGFRIESKYLAEDISSPFNTMDSLFGEHLQCTVRNLSFFVWIILASVVFGFERHNNLNMAFWS